MTIAHPAEPTPRKPLRLWPGVVLAIVLALFRYGIPLVASDAELFSFPLALIALFGGLLAAVAVVVWWLFFSRAPWSERVGALVLMVAALFATSRVVDKSIAEGMMGMMLFIYSIPLLSLALVVWAVATRRLPDGARRASLVAAIVLACAPWTLLRTGGVIGSGAEWHWRWTPTPEDRLLAQARDEPIAAAPTEKAPPVAGAAPAEIPKDRARGKRGQRGGRSGGSPASSQDRTGRSVNNREGSRLARLSRSRARRHRSRRPDQHRLVHLAAGRNVAPADRTGLVILRGPRRPSLHPGAARRRRDRRLPTKCPRASRSGDIATRSASGSRMAVPVRARRRPSTTIASTRLVRPAS